MPFNYQALKNLTGTSFIDGSITTGTLADRTIPTADIAAGSVTSSKLANSAVGLSTSTVTNTLPVGKGGTGLTSVGGANTLLRVNSSNNGLEYAAAGFSGIQVFTGGGTWNRPAGVRYIKVKLVAGGGGGSGHGESGGAGGYSERVLDVTGIGSVGVTVGAVFGEIGIGLLHTNFLPDFMQVN